MTGKGSTFNSKEVNVLPGLSSDAIKQSELSEFSTRTKITSILSTV